MATKHPLAVNATMGFIVGGLGDLACQKYIYKRSASEGYNFQQAFEMGITRMVVISPFLHVYYPWLVKVCPGKAPQRVVGRVILDQLIGSPIVICSVMATTCLFRGKEPKHIYNQIMENAFNAWTVGLQYWPFIHTLNFGFVPVVHQPLVAGFGSVYWYAMLSYYSSKEKEEVDVMNVIRYGEEETTSTKKVIQHVTSDSDVKIDCINAQGVFTSEKKSCSDSEEQKSHERC